MGLKERVEEFRRREHGNMLREDAYAASEVNDVVDEVSEMATESDALMAEMVKVLAGLDPSQLTDDQALNLTGVLDRYNQYKDQTND